MPTPDPARKAPPMTVAERNRAMVARLKKAGGARTSLRLTPAAVAALETLKARHPEAGQNDLICQAIEAAARGV